MCGSLKVVIGKGGMPAVNLKDDINMTLLQFACTTLIRYNTNAGSIIPIRTRFQTTWSTRLAGGWLLNARCILYSAASVLHYVVQNTTAELAERKKGQL